jgi:hypothetical protein
VADWAGWGLLSPARISAFAQPGIVFPVACAFWKSLEVSSFVKLMTTGMVLVSVIICVAEWWRNTAKMQNGKGKLLQNGGL